ncbi:MAG: hypothetical protein DRR15_09460 [Gammaproteobacteria bacterium]|nr:MAG: hypothetical protein DRR15_09460 [Gammaproteobacteria bacterium]
MIFNPVFDSSSQREFPLSGNVMPGEIRMPRGVRDSHPRVIGAPQQSSKTLAAWSIIGAQDPFKDKRYSG